MSKHFARYIDPKWLTLHTFSRHIIAAIDALRYNELNYAIHTLAIIRLFDALRDENNALCVLNLFLKCAHEYLKLYNAQFSDFSCDGKLTNILKRARSHISK